MGLFIINYVVKIRPFTLIVNINAILCNFPLWHSVDISLQITNENWEREHGMSVVKPDGPIDTYSLPQDSSFPAFIITFRWYVITACVHISARRARYRSARNAYCSSSLAWTDWILLFSVTVIFLKWKAAHLH